MNHAIKVLGIVTLPRTNDRHRKSVDNHLCRGWGRFENNYEKSAIKRFQVGVGIPRQNWELRERSVV